MALRKQTLVVIAGPNGSGKTTLARTLRSYAWFQDFTYINADQIAEEEFGDWNAPTARSRAALRAANMVSTALRTTSNFAVETVLSNSGVRLMQRAHAAGYLVRLYYVGTSDPTINIARVAERVSRSGHDIPSATIVRRYHESMETLPDVLSIADHSYVYDNSRDNRPMQRLFRMASGELAHSYTNDLPAWATKARDAALATRAP